MTSCFSAKIPTNEARAKRVVERNKKHIEAIVSFHSLSNPFTKTDTVIFKLPERTGSITIPTSLDSRLESVLNTQVTPLVLPGKDQQVKEVIRSVVLDTEIDYTHIDEYVEIKLSGTTNNISVNYKILEVTQKQVLETQQYKLDTRTSWYQEPIVKLVLLLIAASILIIIINNLTNAKARQKDS